MRQYLLGNGSVKRLTGFRVSYDFIEALDLKIKSLVKQSEVRAEANGRNTIMGRDL